MAEMTAAAAIDLIRRMDAEGIANWLDGGWAVDALLGEQTRPHGDLDILLDERHLPALQALFLRGGFEACAGDAPSNLVFVDRSGLKVDVHAIRFEADGTGILRMADGQEWVFPASGFAGRGTIEGAAVRCLTAEAPSPSTSTGEGAVRVPRIECGHHPRRRGWRALSSSAGATYAALVMLVRRSSVPR